MFFGCIQYKEVEAAVQKDGEDNSAKQVEALRLARLIKCDAYRRADNGRREHMQKRRADEPQISREYRLKQRIARERREEEKRIFRRRESEGDGHHVDDGVYRLVVLAPAQDGELGHHVLDDFLHGRPYDEGERGRARGGEDPKLLRFEIRGGEFLHRDNDRDRNHTREEGESNEPPRLRVDTVFAPPEPEPCESGKHPAPKTSNNKLELAHRPIILAIWRPSGGRSLFWGVAAGWLR